LSIQAIDSRLDDKRLEFLIYGTSKTQDYQTHYNALILFTASGFTQLAEKAPPG
jgi:hypothetical protein